MKTHPATLSVDDLLAECEIRRQRRSGPGGQHRNKVETAVIIRHVPTGVEAEANERRSQEQNRRVAIDRLRIQLACDVRSEMGDTAGDTNSELWRQRTRGRRVNISVNHEDFAAILSEALDHLFECGLDIPQAAQRLSISNSQLIKLIQKVPRMFARLNDLRVEQGLHRLK